MAPKAKKLPKSKMLAYNNYLTGENFSRMKRHWRYEGITVEKPKRKVRE